MKIVDQTPFYNENGELSIVNRLRSILEFGPGWIKEIEAQKSVISVLNKSLDKNYTMLCNIIPPGLDARIPLILVGPTGLYVMIVTPRAGMFRAKGDQWGVLSGNSIRAEKPNLLTRAERMARAIQVYLQRQGYLDLFNVEAILLCSDPATNVDSMRPVIRVIMRDMLEHFAASIPQARIVLSPESAFDIVNRLLNPPPPPPSKPVEAPQPGPAVVPPAQTVSPFVSPFAMPASAPLPASAKESVSSSPFSFPETSPASVEESASPVPGSLPETSPSSSTNLLARLKLTRNQILLLVGMAVIWVLIIAAFAFLIAITMNPPSILLK
ncbi:MAG: hypothetical protein ABSA23_09675 [Anaerolineales bacterium]|jgi:hypothetical protein